MLSISMQAVPGAYARQAIPLLLQGSITVSNFRAVILALGTNDLCDTPPSIIADHIVEIISYIRYKNPTCRIGVSGILPRYCDRLNPPMLTARDEANKAISSCCKALCVEFFKSETCLFDNVEKIPMYQLFRPQDGIHLSDTGIWLYKRYLEGKVASLIGLKPQWNPSTGDFNYKSDKHRRKYLKKKPMK